MWVNRLCSALDFCKFNMIPKDSGIQTVQAIGYGDRARNARFNCLRIELTRLKCRKMTFGQISPNSLARATAWVRSWTKSLFKSEET